MIDQFITASNHFQLQDRVVALMLREHTTITPPVLLQHAKALNLGTTIEAANLLATWLLDDGWVNYSSKPFVGKGMSAVWSYEPTAKWNDLNITRT